METKQENKLLHLLLQVISELNASFERKDTGGIVIEGMNRIFKFESSFFYVLDEKRENFVLETASDAAGEKESFPVGYGFIGWVGKSGEVLTLSDKIAENKSIHFISAPVKGKKGVMGVIGGRKIGASAFGEDEKELIVLFGSQVGAIVERYIYHQRLRRSKEFRDIILYSIPSGIIVVNPDLVVKTYNNSALIILDEDVNLKGKSIYGVFNEGKALNGVRQARDEGTAIKNIEFCHKGRFLNISLVPMQGEDSPVCDIMIVVDDLTETRKAYEEKERGQRLSSLGQFAAGIAHELRNPLTGINIILEMVKEDPGISHESTKLIDKVLNENAHLEDMVTSMLEITKPMDLKVSAVKLNKVLTDFLADIKKIAEKRQIKLAGKGLEKEVEAMLDVKKINQALINLFNNSMDSMKKGGLFTLELASEGDAALIILKDTGAGIPQEIMDKIYEPFYTTKQAGTGLGLHITRSIINHHKGRIIAESDGSSYTMFKIYLPLEKGHK